MCGGEYVLRVRRCVIVFEGIRGDYDSLCIGLKGEVCWDMSLRVRSIHLCCQVCWDMSFRVRSIHLCHQFIAMMNVGSVLTCYRDSVRDVIESDQVN